jgi:hypothetical protein
MWPRGEPVPGGYLEWQVGAERFDEFLDYLRANEPWPKAVLGPVALSFHYAFYWWDPDSLGPVPEQLTGHCTPNGSLPCDFGISLSRRSYVQPDLWFPYSPGDPRLRDLIQLAASELPFSLSPRHFRLAVPQKAKLQYNFRRFDASSLLAA